MDERSIWLVTYGEQGNHMTASVIAFSDEDAREEFTRIYGNLDILCVEPEVDDDDDDLVQDDADADGNGE